MHMTDATHVSNPLYIGTRHQHELRVAFMPVGWEFGRASLPHPCTLNGAHFYNNTVAPLPWLSGADGSFASHTALLRVSESRAAVAEVAA